MTAAKVAGVILAGGLSRRMGGGDKALLEIGGKPILERVIERFGPQVGHLVLNVNGDPERFAAYGLPVAADPVEGFAGPLAGVLAGLDWTSTHHREIEWVVSAASDSPFLPEDLVARLAAAVTDRAADMACAASGGRNHPVFGLWPVRLRNELRRAMVEEDIKKVDVWTARYALAVVDFEDRPFDPFFNANRPEDLERAEALLSGARAGA
jgi:molybdopterin-guanine dinucleotide biosynthesis protein A